MKIIEIRKNVKFSLYFCGALEYVLPVRRNLLESGRGHSGTILDCYTAVLK